MILATFAPTVNLITARAVIARKPKVRAFFVPYSSLIAYNIAVACTYEVKPNVSHSNFSRCDGFTVGGNGGDRFLIRPNHNSKSMSKSSPKTPEALQSNFVNNFLNADAARYYAKELRLTAVAALENEEVDNAQALNTLYMAELLQDIADSFINLTEGGKG